LNERLNTAYLLKESFGQLWSCCVIDGVLEPAAAIGSEADDAPGVVFHAAAGLDTEAIAAVQVSVVNYRDGKIRVFDQKA
jgi:hypothetical protein